MPLGNQHRAFAFRQVIRAFCLGLICVLFALQAGAAVPTSNAIVYSSNKRFFAELSQFDLATIQVAVFDTASKEPTLVWSKRITTTNPLGGMPLYLRTVLLNNDGNAVVYHEHAPWGDRKDLLILHKDLEQEYWNAIKISEQVESEKHGHIVVPKQEAFGGACMELLLEDEKSSRFALWIPSADRWFVLNLKTGEPEKASDDLVVELNGRARAKALESIQSAAPSTFRNLIDPLARRASAIIPGIKTNSNVRYFRPEEKIAYRFLAARKIPADREYLDGLFSRPVEKSYTAVHFGFNEVRMFFQSNERDLADLLLAQWNGATNVFIDPEPYPADPYEQHFYLGRIYGKARLPIPAAPKSGNVWVLLIPNNVPVGEWPKSTAILAARLNLNDGPMAPHLQQNQRFEQVEFIFGTLSPGEYRLKAIWDHRSPIALASEDQPALSTGDYQSAESAPFKIKAGELLEDIVLECTNRVGEASSYYAADQKWNELWSAEIHPPQMSSFHPMGEFPIAKQILHRPVNDWLLTTNQNRIGAAIRKIELVESAPRFTDEPVQQLRMRISVQRYSHIDPLSVSCFLADEHGCTFQGTVVALGPSTILAEWPAFPRSTSTMKLRVIDEGRESYRLRGDPEASFTIKNLVESKTADWQPEPFPIRRNLDLMRAELRSLANKNEPDFAFFQGDKETGKWQADSVYYQDRWGNSSDKLSGFCKAESVLKLKAQFRRRRTAQFSDEEKWTIPVAAIPAAGEYAVIGQSKQLAGATLDVIAITGTGEFTYNGNQIVAATNHISSTIGTPGGRGAGMASLWPYMGGKNVYLKDGGTVVSLIPHVSVRFSGLTPKQEFCLLEESEELLVPRNQLPDRNTLRFLPLNSYTFNEPRSLTFIVQNLREAEFFVPAR
jgi:hypothetical protein